MTFFTLLGAGILLFTCSLVAGYLPVLLVASSPPPGNLTPNPAHHAHSSQPALKRRRWITTIGVGILIGVAFAIILPEGIHSMYQPPREQVLIPTQRVLPTDQAYTLKPAHSIGSTPSSLDPLPSPSTSSSPDSASTDLEGLFAAVMKATSEDSNSNSNTDWQGSMNKFKVDAAIKSTKKQQDSHAHGHAHAAPAATVPATAEKEQGHAHGHSHSHGEGVVLKTTKITAPATRTLLSADHAHEHDHEHDHAHEHAATTPAATPTSAAAARRSSSSPISSSRFVDVDTPVGSHAEESSSNSQHSHVEEELRSAISHATALITNPVVLHCFEEGHGSGKMGFAMVIGFAIMLLFERIKGQVEGSGHHVQNIDVEMQISASPAMSGNRGSNAPANDQLRSRAAERANAAAAASGSASSSSSTASASSSSNSLAAPDQNENLAAGLSSPEMRAARERDIINSVGASPRLGLGLPKEQNNVVHATPITSPAPHMNFPHHHAAGNSDVRKFDPFVLAGVFVYALVDGFILGANAVGAQGEVDSKMFYAIMLHKAPTAFGVACFLLYQGRTVSEIRKQLALYALTTPLSSLVMFTALGATDLRRLGDGSFLGLCMLFSGGCYVFTVAMHILPEIQHHQHQPKQQASPMSANASVSPVAPSSSSNASASAADANGVNNDADAADGKSMSWQSVWLIIFGLCLPLAASYYQERAPLLS